MLTIRVLLLVAVLPAVVVAAPALVAQDTATESPSSDDEEATNASDESTAENDTQASEWTELLIDGTLAGWVQFGGNASFTIQRNEIVGITRPGIEDSFLCTEAEYADFELELECKIDIGLNSGIQIRSQVDRTAARPQVYGYQVEIDSSSRAWTGSLYDQRSGWLATTEDNRAAREAFILGQWNQIRIVAIGSRIRTEVNGVPAIDFSDATERSGFIGLQIHRTELADSLEVRWRRLRIRARGAETDEK